jgi:hypothetical protein
MGVNTPIQGISPASPSNSVVAQVASRNYQTQVDAIFRSANWNCTRQQAALNLFAAAADIRVTPGVSIGINASPPPPELRPIFAELPFNKRYFQTSYNAGTAPGSSDTADLVPIPNVYAAGYGTGMALPIVMRSSPTVVFYDGAGTSNKCSLYSGGSWANAYSFLTYVQASAGTILFASSNTNTLFINYTASAEL